MENSNRNIIKELEKDINTYPLESIRQLLNQNFLSYDDLNKLNIPNEIKELVFDDSLSYDMFNFTANDYKYPKRRQFYFWGTQGVGKTALIYSLVRKLHIEKGVIINTNRKNIDHIEIIKSFQSNYIMLPSRSNNSIYESVLIEKQNKENIELLEVNWQFLYYIFQLNVRLSNRNFFGKKYLDSFLDSFKEKRKRTHFFLLEYKLNQKSNYSGLTQSDYLTNLIRYFNEKKLFNKNVEAIYLIMTKPDLLICSDKERDLREKQYAKENFPSIINMLKYICTMNKIKLNFYTYSIGNIYFQNLCEIKNTYESSLENIIQNEKFNKKGVIQRITSKLKT